VALGELAPTYLGTVHLSDEKCCKFSTLYDPKKPEKGSANLKKGTYFFRKGPELLYFEGQFL
jgi:hypothetical protein